MATRIYPGIDADTSHKCDKYDFLVFENSRLKKSFLYTPDDQAYPKVLFELLKVVTQTYKLWALLDILHQSFPPENVVTH